MSFNSDLNIFKTSAVLNPRDKIGRQSFLVIVFCFLKKSYASMAQHVTS